MFPNRFLENQSAFSVISDSPFRHASVMLEQFRFPTEGSDFLPYFEDLSATERHRVSSFLRPEDGLRWGWMRSRVRQLLGEWLGQRPADVVLAVSPHGKPYLPDAEGRHFNLSHSEDWLLVGLSDKGAIGVDVEIPRPDFPYLELAAEHFTEAEVASIRSKPPAHQASQFLKIWTAKEALLKAIGLGLEIEPATVELQLGDNDHPVGILRIGGRLEPPQSWLLQCETQGEVVASVVTQAL